MTACFWTDFAGCQEACGSVSSDPVLLLLGGAGAVRTLVPFLANTSGLILGNLQFDSVDVYQADPATNFSGCSWPTFLATNDATLVGTSISPTPASPPVDVQISIALPLTWKLVTDLIGSHVASGTNIPLTNNGADGSSIGSDVLFTTIGFTSYDNSGFLIVAVLRDTDTGQTWNATALADTCS